MPCEPPTKPLLGVVIGEGPGYDEVEDGLPFQGPTGKQLDLELAKAGVPRCRTLVINAMGCKPPLGAGEVEKRKATQCCSPWFKAQLKQHGTQSPAFAMGRWAHYAFTGEEKAIEPNRGYLRKTKTGRPWIGSWHPTYAFFHNPYEWGSFTVDLERFGLMIQNRLPTDVKLVLKGGDLKELQAIYRWAKKRGFFAVDLETHPVAGDKIGITAKDPTQAGINLMSVGVPNAGLSVRWKKLTLQAKKLFKRMLLDKTLIKVFQNGFWFDIPVLARHSCPVNEPIMDIRDMRRACSTTSPLSLHYMGSIYLSTPAWKSFSDDDVKA